MENEDAETLAQLLAQGVDPDEVCHDITLLTHAIDTEGDGALQSGRPLTVHTTAVLLAFGADPQLSGPDGLTPIGQAAYYGHDLAVEVLQRHISPTGPHPPSRCPPTGSSHSPATGSTAIPER